jgi:putative membrane protein insertion efficiency factor
MKIKISMILISLLSLTVAYSHVSGESSFPPWDADVKVADQNSKIKKTGNSARRHQHHADKKTPSEKKHRQVYNGPQGGGYFLIRFFQVVISPQDGPNCRFNPVCSAYGKKAVEKYGILLGSTLAGDRIIRCNPYSPPGDDPVPDKIFER